MAVNKAGHDQLQRCIDGLGALEAAAQIGRLADRDNAVLTDGNRTIGDDVPIFVEGKHNTVLDQDIDIFHRGLVLGCLSA